MKLTIRLITEDGDEAEHELPAKYEVCTRCDGHGSHLNPSIGQHAYTREEFEEAFHDPEDRAEYFKRGGIYDVSCGACGGERVVSVVDTARCTPAELGIVRRYRRQERERLQSEADERRTMLGEMGVYGEMY